MTTPDQTPWSQINAAGYQPTLGAVKNEQGYWVMPDGSLAPGQVTPGMRDNPQAQIFYDKEKDLDYNLVNGHKVYHSPVAFDGTKTVYKQSKNGQPISDTGGGAFHGRPTWNPKDGKWDVGLDMGKVLSWAAAAGISGGVINAAMAGGAAAGGLVGSGEAAVSSTGGAAAGAGAGAVAVPAVTSTAGAAGTGAGAAGAGTGVGAAGAGTSGAGAGVGTMTGGPSIWNAILPPVINAFTGLWGANKQADTSERSTQIQADAYKYGADAQSKAAAETLAYTRAEAENKWRNDEATRAANYQQYVTRAGGVSSLGDFIGFKTPTPPAYVPTTDPRYDAGGPGPVTDPNNPRSTTMPLPGGKARGPADPGAIPPPPASLEEALDTAAQITGGQRKPGDAAYWAQHWARDPGYTWKRMLGWQAGGRDVPASGPYAGGSGVPPPMVTSNYGPSLGTMAQPPGMMPPGMPQAPPTVMPTPSWVPLTTQLYQPLGAQWRR